MKAARFVHRQRCEFMAGMAILAGVFLAGARLARAGDWYVTTNGIGTGGDSWANATNDIQTAIDLSQAGDTIWVSNGVYNTGGRTNFPKGTLLTNRVVIHKAVTVRSANNDPANTIIMGAWDPDATNGPAAVRCVYMTNANGCALIGFTLTNGATLLTGASEDRNGGGVSAHSYQTNAMVSNCVISGNSAGYRGGGVNGGTLHNCLISGNSVAAGGLGGGINWAYLFNCTVTENQSIGVLQGNSYNCTISSNAGVPGGGYQANFYNCTFIGNTGHDKGGGWRAGGSNYILSNCVLIGNSAPDGAGAYEGTLYNCLLIGNSATNAPGAYRAKGGGSYNSTLYNCTLVGNSSVRYGGGIFLGTSINSIVYFNTATLGGSNWYSNTAGSFSNSCTAPAAAEWAAGNITDDPAFVDQGSGSGPDHVAGNYALKRESPCINAGITFDWMNDSRDLGGHARIQNAIVDMGCYEFIYRGTVFSFR